ncbi:hypothetical protein [Aquipseudomonas alcaligenes]|nr:hypothetical protein [Pseudomonas alcaligenes]
MQTFQMLAATAASLTIPAVPDMNYLKALMNRPFPASRDGLETPERLEWMLEAEARYRVTLAQKILDVAQAAHK